jgi:hypothetical protein
VYLVYRKIRIYKRESRKSAKKGGHKKSAKLFVPRSLSYTQPDAFSPTSQHVLLPFTCFLVRHVFLRMTSRSGRLMVGCVALASVAAGLAYLFLFSLPHSTHMFNVPTWKVR